MTKELADIFLFKHAETERAILFSEDNDKDAGFWLPKSQIELEHDKDNLYIVTMPTWLASDKEISGY